MVLEHLGERRRRYRSPTPHPEHERIAFAERARRVENHQRPRAQQNRVLALGLHRHGRRSPHAVRRAGLGPGRESDFRRPATVSTRISNAALMRPVPDPDARSVSMAAGTPSWGQRQLVRHDVVLRTEQRSTRSQELSFRSRFIAMAHRSRARMRWCTALAVSAFTCQVGIWIPSISAVLTSENQPAADTGDGIAFEAAIQFCAYHRSREPPRFCSSTRSLFSATVGTPAARRSSEGGSPPDWASFWLARPVRGPRRARRVRPRRRTGSSGAARRERRQAGAPPGRGPGTRRAQRERRRQGHEEHEERDEQQEDNGRKGYEGKRESTRCRSRSRPRAGRVGSARCRR